MSFQLTLKVEHRVKLNIYHSNPLGVCIVNIHTPI
ncbi:hypothetical protein Xedl_01355 [Xenorhabdus eapokensis]|uniref:Uncharacterized protein n=1 Tax=Xenorhabdus eapokensis TaxID=1873482 RepID=A0A1Q5TUE6_9GAMM|nr:hypothetical protein Xedl_01355 [Xenorhabdus eapokensis]